MSDKGHPGGWQGGEGAEDGRDPAGRTALMTAAAAGDADEVARLLAEGADPALRDAAGRSAADHAREGGHGDLAQRLSTDTVSDKMLR